MSGGTAVADVVYAFSRTPGFWGVSKVFVQHEPTTAVALTHASV